jgi:hypothetical protein
MNIYLPLKPYDMSNPVHPGTYQDDPVAPPAPGQPGFTSIQEPVTRNHPPAFIKKLSILIPAYNEENTIATVLDRINEVKLIGGIEK